MYASHYRECQEWKDENMPLSTTSNEAARMYDAAAKQLCSRHEDKSVGGTEGALKKMFEADPDFVLGHVYKEILGFSAGPSVSIHDLAKSQWDHLSDLEKWHYNAFKYYSSGYSQKACDEWTKILKEYPKDVLSLKMIYDTQIYLADFEQQLDIVARVLPSYKKKVDFEYGYVVGMQAFSLEETKSYDAAEKQANEALECDCQDAWATHAKAHVYEMTGRYKEGIDFLASTQKDWETVNGLQCHIHWHSMLFYIEKGDIEGALNIYDNYIAPRATSSMFELSDATASLYRLKMQGVDAGKKRWKDLSHIIPKHLNDHSWCFYDMCVLLGLCGAKMEQPTEAFLQSLKSLTKNVTEDSTDFHKINKTVNQYVCDAIVHYENNEYDKAVDILLPHKDEVQRIGGSHAQRDVVNLLLIHSATKSHLKEHNKLALKILEERKICKDTPLTQQLMSKIVISHEDT